MPEKEDVFVNPSAPPGVSHMDVEATPSRLTNADFRRLLMTPRVGGPGSSSSSMAPPSDAPHSSADPVKLDKAEERRRKKSYYAKLKRAEEDIMAELAKKYRDRAKERREVDMVPESPAAAARQSEENTAAAPAPGAYRAVAPDLKSGRDAAERRRQQIQESKFLGGDMEHTHLVKGLDYALLQKVRSEIQAIELEHEDELEKLADGAETRKEQQPREEEVQFKTKLGKNIYRTLFGGRPAAKNELFLPGRTAYRIDLDEEFVEFDIPTTVVRSKADCPQVETATTLTTNDIVINKLTQILSYLRQGRAGRRLRRKDRGAGLGGESGGATTAVASGATYKSGVVAVEDIYADTAEYVPAPAAAGGALIPLDIDRDSSRRDKDRDRRQRSSYFGDDTKRERRQDRDRARDKDREEREKERTEREREREQAEKTKEKLEREKRDKERFEQEKSRESNWLGLASSAAKKEQKNMGMSMAAGGYAECYPGLDEMHDALDDSDEEVDYSKMDQGNRKGPVGRWDFANQDDYGDYMNQKEAMPKAAFQYGVKMADGRKTQGRKLAKTSEKNERAELDREWQKISAIISKRQSSSGGGSASKRAKP